MKPKLISFHPKLAAILDGVFSLILIWWLTKIDNPWLILVWFLFRIGWWVALVVCMYYPPFIHRFKHLISLVIFNIGLTSLLIFIDWKITWYLAAFVFLAIPLFSFWLVPARAEELTILGKPHRRARFLMTIFGIAGLWAGAQAIIFFQILDRSLVWLVFVSAAIFTTAVSAWWWSEYGIEFNKNFLYHLFSLLLSILEISYVIFLWPLGYMISGVLVAWIWYLVWLLFRFSLSKEGVDWARQKFVLAGNVLLMISFLVFVARWR